MDPNKNNNKNNWTKEEEASLKELYSNHSNLYLSKLLKKTKASIDNKGALLGLKKTTGYRKKVNIENNKQKRHAWTDEDISFLKENYKKKPYYEIAEKLYRTPTAVAQKLRQMNLRKYPKRTAH